MHDRSQIEGRKEQVINTLVNKSITCQKYDQTINSKDKSSRKKKEQNKEVCIYIVISTFKEVITQKQVVDISEETTPVMNQVPNKNTKNNINTKNIEISISCVIIGKEYNQNEIVIHQIFACTIDLIKEEEVEILNPSPFKNVNIKIIGQSEKMQSRYN